MSHRPLTILCDIDDVLIKFVPRLVDELDKRHGLNVKPEDIKDWNIAKYFKELTIDQMWKPVHEPTFWDNVEPIEQSQHYLETLLIDGHQIYLTTATQFDVCAAKFKKIKELFPFVTDRNIIVTKNKQMIRGDVLIDDAMHNLENGNYHKLLFHQPHNANIDESQYGAKRVRSWNEVYTTISKLSFID